MIRKEYLVFLVLIISIIFLFKKHVIALSSPGIIGLHLKDDIKNVLVKKLNIKEIINGIKQWQCGKICKENDDKGTWELGEDETSISIRYNLDYWKALNIFIEIQEYGKVLFSLSCERNLSNTHTISLNDTMLTSYHTMPLIQMKLKGSILMIVVDDLFYQIVQRDESFKKLHGQTSNGLGCVMMPESYVVDNNDQFSTIFEWRAPLKIEKEAEALLCQAL